MFILNRKRNKKSKTNEETVKIIRNSLDYRYALEHNEKMDLSMWDFDDNDLQNLNIKDLKLFVPLRRCYLPKGGRCQCYFGGELSSLVPLVHYSDDFIDLRKSDFRGNTVIGSLSNIVDGDDELVFLYNENTFDDDYKKFHDRYFIDKDAPEELKKFFYEPIIVEVEDYLEEAIYKNNFGEEKKFYDKAAKRPKLTFEYYLENYKYLHRKYLDRFKMSQTDRKLIDRVEKYGINSLIDSYSDNCTDLSKEYIKRK